MPDTIHAAVVEQVDGPFVLKTLSLPPPGPGEVRVRIHASGVNPLDTKIRAGKAEHARHPLPAVLGLDLAGVVEAVGSDVTAFRVGDEVWGMTGGVGGHQGSLASAANVDARLLAHKPRALSMREAAALPLVFITAWEGLIDRARLAPGMKVLVQGGSGGVGRAAVQIALARGADVYATDRPERAGELAAMGVTPIDRDRPVDDYVAQCTGGDGFDVVYDTVGGAVLDASFRAVRRFGHVVSALGWGTHSLAPLSFRSATYSGVFTLLPLLSGEGRSHYGRIMAEATLLAGAGKLRVTLDPHRFTLATVADAHALLTSQAARGKVVVDIA
ncbi:zinc-dependent alcohol dehydrogenase family protein [Luteibacter sp. UNCMF366Tsu5.1]|uniref:zinc-dependent alcohol dehydrogenase family protein n=1 Tax=Luteibacter sp. UNCMF366Tsu5.1 TaxID=1502758 RepID=UPI0009086B04|nr:zinc-dependent alcohol dehydrogenase family protein [Luteibacter sp. UNCMF366Tsu5.1]SFW25314.1 NADPH:quinone reductase [Luteibacter sp. UNCMF366Tsu5.1]